MKTPPAPSEDLLFSPPSQGAASVPSGPAAQHASSSDSGMSDERNADSVLFKLDTLTAMQSQKKKGGGAPQQMANLVAPTQQADAGSGLIDLRTLGGAPSPVEQSAEASASGSDVASSAALSQSSLLSTSSMTGAAAMPNAAPLPSAPVTQPSRTPLVILSVLALLALVAAVTAIVLRG